MINVDIPDAYSYNVVADWVELSVAIEKASVSKAAVTSRLELDSGEEPADTFISSVWDELEYRMNLYGGHPPFIISSGEVAPNLIWEENPEYVMCLILSLTGNPKDPTPTGKLFERVSREALKNYLRGIAVIFGHPNGLKVSDICSVTNEKFKSEIPTNNKDRGLDVVAWIPFGDQRGNQILVLMQCAGGANWTSKTGDIVLRAWKEKYITFGCTPVRGFSTVVIISNSEKFEEISLEADLLFDRARIYRNTKEFAFEGDLRNDVLSWCTSRLKEI